MMPFAGGPSTAENGTLIFAAVAALLNLVMLAQPRTAKRAAVKTASVVLLAVLAFLAGGPWLLVAALLLSSVGDAFLAFDGEKPFLSGLGAFFAAHLAYVALFLTEGMVTVALTAPRLAIGVAMTLATGVMIVRLRPAVGDTLRLPVTAYGLAILAMGLSSLVVAPRFVPLGAVMFMASDTMLGTERFLVAHGSAASRPLAYGVWTLYWLGQATITLGFLT